jgi:hypothetical protein
MDPILEAAVFGLPPTVMDARDDRGRSVADAFAALDALPGSAASLRRAAEA